MGATLSKKGTPSQGYKVSDRILLGDVRRNMQYYSQQVYDGTVYYIYEFIVERKESDYEIMTDVHKTRWEDYKFRSI